MLKIIKIKFSYTEDILPPRCRKTRPVRFHDGVAEIEIPEITAADAPVAIRSHGFIRFDKKKPFTVDYRWWQGRLWTSVSLSNCEPRGHTSGEDDWDHPALQDEIDVTTQYATCQDYCAGINVSASKSRIEVETYLRIRMTRHLIVDGVWYRPASEPRYVVNTFGLGNNHGGTALFATGYYNSNIPHDRYFSLFDLDKALALGTEIATKRGDNKSLPITVNGDETFEVLIPEAVKVNPVLQHGDGDPFLNKLDSITSIGADIATTGVLVALAAASEIPSHS